MKPRIFYHSGENRWVCADVAPFYHYKAVRIYYELGSGKTPKEAYENAFPKTLMQKVKYLFKFMG